jgi:hypothetical protein
LSEERVRERFNASYARDAYSCTEAIATVLVKPPQPHDSHPATV